MGISNNLLMHILRIITPEEVGEIATRHNGGKFFSLTELVSERLEKNIYRDFSEEILESEAKILPFKTKEEEIVASEKIIPEGPIDELALLGVQEDLQDQEEKMSHAENENMASFILVEKARLKKSQRTLKQKEIIDLYKKNANVDVEQIKHTNQDVSK